jgi:hypothetical protein
MHNDGVWYLKSLAPRQGYKKSNGKRLIMNFRCSSRKKCQKDKQHNLIDLEKHFMKVKEQFIKWNDAREEKLLLLEFKVCGLTCTHK